MNRRHLLSLASSAFIARPVRAQPRPPILGFINDTGSNAGPLMISFLRGLGRHGFISNQTVLLMYQQADRYEEAQGLAENLVKRGATAIVTLNAPNMALAARDATKTIPIVFACAGDPLRLGLVESFEKPGGNLTGVTFSSQAAIEKRAQILATLAPAGKSVGLLINPANKGSAALREDFKTAMSASGRTLTIYEAGSEAEIDAAFAQAARDGVGAIAIDDDSRLARLRETSITAAARAKMPTLFASREDAAAGRLMSHGDVRAEMMIKLGELAGRALKGEKPAGMAVARAEKFESVLTLKTAKAMGLEVSPQLRALAGEVME